MPNYDQAKIYSIRSHQTDDVYIGSTCQTLSRRMSKHRTMKKAYEKGKANKVTSFEILQYPDAYIELVENYPCLCRDGLNKREGEIIRATPNCVNKNIPGRKMEQYYQDNAERIKQQRKQYRQDNAGRVKQYQQQYKQDNAKRIKQYNQQKHECECGGRYTTISKSVHFKTEKHREYEAFMTLTEEQVREWLGRLVK